MDNLLSIYIDDEDSNSLIVDGSDFVHYNTKFNRFIGKISSEIQYNKNLKEEYKIGLDVAGEIRKLTTSKTSSLSQDIINVQFAFENFKNLSYILKEKSNSELSANVFKGKRAKRRKGYEKGHRGDFYDHLKKIFYKFGFKWS